MNNSSPPAFLIALFPFFFAAMWFGISFVLSTTSGWRRLATQFTAQSEPSGERFYMQSGWIGSVRYGSCLIVHTAPDGLRLSPLLPFRFGSPPLLIPWSAIHNATADQSRWFPSVTFEVGSPSITTIILPKRIFESLPALGKLTITE